MALDRSFFVGRIFLAFGRVDHCRARRISHMDGATPDESAPARCGAKFRYSHFDRHKSSYILFTRPGKPTVIVAALDRNAKHCVNFNIINRVLSRLSQQFAMLL